MFVLDVPVTSAAIESLKADLTKLIPQVKSSHRCEAIARGLNFKTYAALRAAAGMSSGFRTVANGRAFSAYLKDHGFTEAAVPFYRALARIALRAVLEDMPKLTASGIGIGEPRRKQDGQWESVDVFRERFAHERAELLSDGYLEAFLLSLALLARVKRTQTVRGTSSYRIKHIAEKYECTYPEGENLGPRYVPNGVLIAAAIHTGFSVKTYREDSGRDSLNVSFNMSKTSLDDLDCEIRPDGARAQARQRKANVSPWERRWRSLKAAERSHS